MHLFRTSFTIIILSLLVSACSPPPQEFRAQYQPLTEAVYSTATVVPAEIYTVYSPVNGIIEKSYLEEGQLVEQGALLFQVNNRQSNLNQANAALNVQLAQDSYLGESAILRELEERIRSAQIRAANDSLNFERQAKLWAQNIGSQQSYDTQKLAYELSRNELSSLRSNYSRTKKELARKLELAQNSLQISAANNEEFTITSRLSGTIYEVLKEEGEFVSPQSAVAVVGSTDKFVVQLLIDEVDISYVFPGQKTLVNLDAFGDQVFEAEITRIYPTKDERSQTFKIEATFKEQPARLFNGLSGEANIIIAEKERVLCLPSQLINENNEVNTPKGLVKVTTGLKNLAFTEIISGIDTSTVIYQAE
jgi:multidrug efflux pump subunit AcrA (membrane-fusion protein)